MFASSYDWYVAAIWDDEALDMTFHIPVPAGTSAGTYYLYFKVTADYYDENNNRHDREVLITAEVEVLEGTGSGSVSSGSAGTAFAGVKPNDNDKVVSSNVHALLIADAGVSAPTAKPGENAEILMPLVVNREYLPSDLYFLRNITIEPSIPTTIKDIGNWPFDITSISYVRHLDDMTYNSRADVEYSIPVSQTLPLSVKQPVRVEVGEPTIYDSDAKPEEPIAMSLNIVNKGRSKIYNVSIDVEGKGLSMYEDYYGGDVLPAAKLNPDILVSSTTAGKCSGNLLVHYEDSEGEAYTETVPVSFTVAEQPVVQQPEQNDQIESEPIEQPKKKLSTGAILGGGAAILALGGTGLGIALKKRRGKYEIS